MKIEPIIIVAGEPNSIFFEIFFKVFKKNNFRNPLVLICSKKTLMSQMTFFKYNFNVKVLKIKNIKFYNLNNKSINIIDVKFQQKKVFEKISKKSNSYIENSFSIAVKLIKSNFSKKLINGPISKKTFLNNKFYGITEYLSSKFKVKKTVMLIYNNNLSVSPITTHLSISKVSKKITKKKIIDNIKLIDKFFRYRFNFKPNIGVTGLNPHCEGKTNEEKKIIKPAINFLLKNNLKVFGPYPADTIFLNENRKKFDVIVGMYHDQVLTPIKTLFEYDAINITVGLPFLRLSPDHGPNEKMMGLNKSSPLSLLRAITFLDKR
ncbi:4-hydroxythreonine-4-phosphate dehydrogenase PdxA [Candidatus Pelagibacter communis]|uniref:4-hydroxythreonine-4-phosphate dehydrogenase PdxA n=1 Tax=Candidatus Pelagibacter TaxID=198251 RepID=UPI003EE28C1C